MGYKKQMIWHNQFAVLLLDAMAEGVFTLDANGWITSWNPAMARITGYNADEAVGQSCKILSFSKCFHRECPDDINECKVFEKEKIDPTECQIRHKDGHYIPIIKSARVVRSDDGSPIGVVETITDLTELESARKKAEEARQKLGYIHQFDNIVGKSHVMQDFFNAIRMAAESGTTVLLQGESGTGKELAAGAIHYNSDRANGPLITVNCSALSESLLESELFGHVKGAFTGAHKHRKGRFEEADGGTIFLDEIADISPLIQLKLLRTLQERQVERVGDSRRIHVDFRILTATNKNLYSLVREGKFREDLYYRLKVFPIFLPPLRNRREDIPLLVQNFISLFNRQTKKKIQGVSQETLRIMMEYSWPGNVRELKNAVEHAFVICRGHQIEPSDLPFEIKSLKEIGGGVRVAAMPHPVPRPKNLRKPTKQELIELLYACDWNKAEVARQLGRSRTLIWKYMKDYQIQLEKPTKN